MSNKSVMLSFEVGDLPMIAHAFMIARTTARMCGNKQASERLASYLKTIEALIPEPARLFDAEEWAEICASIQTCKEWSISMAKPQWDRHNHFHSGHSSRIQVRVDDQVWLHHWLKRGEIKEDGPEFNAVKELLEQMAGMDSVQVDEAR